MRPRSLAVFAVEIVVESPLWRTRRDARAILQRAVAAAAAQCEACGEVTIVLTDDKAIRKLNRTWRGRDEPTNVLSFPARLLAPPASEAGLVPVRSLPGGRSARRVRPASGSARTCRRRPTPLASRGTEGKPPRFLGDIVIAFETTAREALADSKPLPHHLGHLAVHGFLHLLGYDHGKDDEAEAMEQLERAILARLDLPDPHAPRETRS
jgi:probable rRNA maturation factor